MNRVQKLMTKLYEGVSSMTTVKDTTEYGDEIARLSFKQLDPTGEVSKTKMNSVDVTIYNDGNENIAQLVFKNLYPVSREGIAKTNRVVTGSGKAIQINKNELDKLISNLDQGLRVAKDKEFNFDVSDISVSMVIVPDLGGTVVVSLGGDVGFKWSVLDTKKFINFLKNVSSQM